MIFSKLGIIYAFLVILNKQQNILLKRAWQCYQQVGIVFLNNLIFDLLNLEQYLNNY